MGGIDGVSDGSCRGAGGTHSDSPFFADDSPQLLF